jgi:diaminopimelate epimerase
MQGLSFIKMHGLGNDFVVIDARDRPVSITPTLARAIANRKTGVGCDQLILIEPAAGRADAMMRIRNADGSEVAACGNGARCVAALLMQEKDAGEVLIESEAGLLRAEAAGPGLISIDLGPARLEWREIPLARAMDTLHLELELGPLRDPVAVNVGNPHAVFFVPDAEAVNLATLGPQLETDRLFPERANIGPAAPGPAPRWWPPTAGA